MKTIKLYTIQTSFVPIDPDGGENRIDSTVECYPTEEERDKAFKKKVKEIKKQIVESFKESEAYDEDMDADFSTFKGIVDCYDVCYNEEKDYIWFFIEGEDIDVNYLNGGFKEVRCCKSVLTAPCSEETIWSFCEKEEEPEEDDKEEEEDDED